VEDLREEFITGYIWPTLRAGAVYEHKYLLGTSFARPLLAQRQVQLAKKVGADAVAHGCTGKGNDQVRFELAAKALAPELKIIAPWREWTINSREEAIAYARSHNVPVEQTTKNIYSRDRNIWHLSHEGGVLEDPANAPEEAMWQWIVSPAKAPDQPTTVEIGFEEGVPVSVNGKRLGAVALIEQLNEIAAANGVGRMEMVENRLVGIKSRGAYETPGGTLLIAAHRELESLCLDRETAHYQQMLSLRYAEMVYYGMWFTPLRESLDAFFAKSQHRVTGEVGLTLFKGNLSVASRRSPFSLYRQNLASFTMTGYNPKDAEGFINLLALPITVPQEAELLRKAEVG
jgi:argininosuccinate synthase